MLTFARVEELGPADIVTVADLLYDATPDFYDLFPGDRSARIAIVRQLIGRSGTDMENAAVATEGASVVGAYSGFASEELQRTAAGVADVHGPFTDTEWLERGEGGSEVILVWPFRRPPQYVVPGQNHGCADRSATRHRRSTSRIRKPRRGWGTHRAARQSKEPGGNRLLSASGLRGDRLDRSLPTDAWSPGSYSRLPPESGGWRRGRLADIPASGTPSIRAGIEADAHHFSLTAARPRPMRAVLPQRARLFRYSSRLV